LQHQEEFTVELSRFAPGLDVDRARLPTVETGVEMTARDEMRMIETQPGGSGHEAHTAHAMRWNVRRAFLGRAIDVDRQRLPMPVELLRDVGVVEDVDRDSAAFC